MSEKMTGEELAAEVKPELIFLPEDDATREAFSLALLLMLVM
jgi:hypothetical protein